MTKLNAELKSNVLLTVYDPAMLAVVADPKPCLSRAEAVAAAASHRTLDRLQQEQEQGVHYSHNARYFKILNAMRCNVKSTSFSAT